ncbi:MAG: hypothetical protein DDT19_02544 [Syntrophomonadaceae bacterium]|nr:hypothetical protein [Bacillota bacterium]
MTLFELLVHEDVWEIPDIVSLLEDLEEVVSKYGLSIFSLDYKEVTP